MVNLPSNTLAIPRLRIDVPPVVPSVQRKPLWLYPNLLSLDAPLVAVAWLFIFSKTWRVDYHPWEAYVALGLTVWGVYVVDRLLDASLFGTTGGKLQARHEFHRRNRKWFILGAALAFMSAAALVVTYMSLSIYAYLFFGIVIVAGFFGLSMLSSQETAEVPHTKNVCAGIGFAFGTAMMAHVYLPELGVYKMLGSREFICFSLLCVLNISAIDLWEHAACSVDLNISASAELMLAIPLAMLGVVCLYYAVIDHEMATRPFFYAILTGAALLQILNRMRGRFSMDALRVLADVALILPVLVYLAAMNDSR